MTQVTPLADIDSAWEYQHPVPIPLLVQLGVTYRCNLTCEHCYALDLRQRNEFTVEELAELADQLVAAGSVALTYSHGESLIRRDFGEIMAVFDDRGFHQTLMNNGFYVTSPERAAALKNGGIRKALVSLDHIDADIHNEHRGNRRAYTVAINATKYLREAGIPRVGFSVAMDTYNYDAIPGIAELAVQLGLTDLSLMQTRYMDGHGFQPDYIAQYKAACEMIYELIVEYNGQLDIYTHDPFMLTQLDERIRLNRSALESYIGANVCNVGTNMVSIDPVGNVTGCNFLRKGFGNVRDEPFGTIWARLVDHYRPVKLPTSGACTTCSVSSSCSSGCLAFHQEGSEFDTRCTTESFPTVAAASTPMAADTRPRPSTKVFLTLTPRRTT